MKIDLTFISLLLKYRLSYLTQKIMSEKKEKLGDCDQDHGNSWQCEGKPVKIKRFRSTEDIKNGVGKENIPKAGCLDIKKDKSWKKIRKEIEEDLKKGVPYLAKIVPARNGIKVALGEEGTEIKEPRTQDNYKEVSLDQVSSTDEGYLPAASMR